MIRASRTVVRSPDRGERRNVTSEPSFDAGMSAVSSDRDGRDRERTASGRRVVPGGGTAYLAGRR